MRKFIVSYILLLSAFFLVIPKVYSQQKGKVDNLKQEVSQIYKANFNESIINKSISNDSKGILRPKGGKNITVLVATPDAADFNTHVLATMQAFGGVTYTVTSNLGALTVAEMLNYNVVWTFNVKKWETETGITPAGWSDKLGSFIDGGGYLLESQFVQSYDAWGLGTGAYITGNKSPFTKSTIDRPTGTFTLGNVAQPTHPIMSGVTTFSTTYFVQDVTVRPGATLICSWSNSFADPAVAVYNNIVAVNANPIMSTGTVTQPGITGDGYKMFHNALVWLFNNQAPIGAPAAVSGLTVTPGAAGALTATLNWTNPSLTAQGAALTELTHIKIFRNSTTTPIHTIATPTIGAAASWVDDAAPAGNNVYYVVATNAAGDGPSASKPAWIGPDVPAAVTNLVLTAEGAGGRLNWTAPTTGLNGGFFEATGLSYRIVRNPGNVVVATDATGTTYLDNTVTAMGTYSYSVTAKNAVGNGGVASSNSVLLNAEGLIQIGSGTSVNISLPIEPYYGYTYSQSIFLQSEINVSNKRITKVFYQYNGNSAWTDQIEVYMGHTAQSTLAGYLPVAGMLKVYDGPLTVTTTPGWVEIALQTPFNYNNTQNLVVAVIEKTPGYHLTADEFLCHATPGGALMSIVKYNDINPYNPATPPTFVAADIKAFRPNIRLFTQDIPASPEISINPSTLAFGEVQVTATGTKSFSIINTGTLPLVIDGITVTDNLNFTVEALTYPLTLNPGGTQVVNVNFNPTTVGLKEATLTVEVDPAVPGTKQVLLTGTAVPKGLLNETFETLTPTTFPPAGWRVINGGGANAWVLYTTDNITPGGSKCATILYNTAAHNDWLITPQLRVTADYKTLKFWARNHSTTFIDLFNVKLSTTGNNEADFTVTLLANQAPPNLWKDYTIDLSAYEGQMVYIAFQAISANKLRLSIDDVSGLIVNLSTYDLEAVSITGPTSPLVGQNVTYQVAVKNKGLEPVLGTAYTVSVFRKVEGGPDVLLSTLNGINLAYQQTANIPWNTNFSATGNQSIYAVVNYAVDENTADNTTPQLNVSVFDASTQFVQVGTGTALLNTMPLNFYFKSSLTQTIYKGSEIGVAGPISHIVYQNDFATNLPNKPVKIWMGNTDKVDLAAGWIPSSQLTLVYEGTLNFPSGVNEIWIPLNQNFIYEGNNLVVMALRPMDAAYFSTNDRFRTTDGVSTNRTRLISSDTAEPNPLNPVGTTVSTSYPNIKLAFNMAGMGTLAGTIVDGAAAPLEGVKVELMGTPRSVLTNAAGQFTMPYIFNGNYNVRLSKLGYYTVEVPVVIEENQTTTLNQVINALPLIEVTGTVVRADNITVPVEGANVTLSGYQNYTAVTGVDGTFTIPNVYGEKTYTLGIKKTGFTDYSAPVVVGTANLSLGTIQLFEIAYPPINLTATINAGSVDLVWSQFDPNATTTFRYDDGTVSGQLGFTSGTANGVMGSVFRRNARILEVTWQTTSNGGPHTAVNVFIFGLNASGMPTNTVLYSAMGVANTDGVWTTHVLPTPVNAPNGFMLALSYNGFLGLAIDNASAPWTFQTNTHFYNSNYTTGTFSTLESANFTKNFLLRAVGFDYGPLAKGNDPNFATTRTFIGEPIMGSYLPKAIPAGEPLFSSLTNVETGSKVFESYSVYRFRVENEANPALWSEIATGVTQTNYTDSNWGTLPWGEYKYAVRAVYTANNLSAPAISNKLVKDMLVPVTVNVTTNGSDNPVGAVVKLTQIGGTNTYTLTAPSGGVVLFPSVWRGMYNVEITLAGHQAYLANNVDFTADVNTHNAQLIEVIVPPYNLSVTTTGMTAGSAKMVWNVDNSIFDNVESYTDFAINNASPWTILDVDGLATYGSTATNFPGENSPMGYIVFNNSTCVPSMATTPEWVAASGNKYFASIAANSTTVSNNDWLISPMLDFKNPFVFRFKGKSITSQYGLERFKVGYSTTTNAPAAFTFVTPAPYATAPTAWTEFAYNIPANAKYVAINCVSLDAFIFMVDDLYIGPANKMNESKAFVGYNVYLDGNLVATEIPETEFLFTGLAAGLYTAGVQSVYTSGTSGIMEIEFNVPESHGVEFTITNAVTTEFIENATITITQGINQVALLNSNASGLAGIELYVGEYTYSVAKAGFQSFTGGFSISDENVDIDIELEPFFNLIFTVINENNVPVNDAVITINGTPMAAGVYTKQVIRGVYNYTVQRATYDAASGTATVVDQDVTVPVTLTFTRYNVTFNVTGDTGTAITDAAITFDGQQYAPGVYTVNNVLPGTYAYTVQRPEHQTVNGNVTVTSANITVNVVLKKFFNVTFTVVNSSAQPIAGATILVAGQQPVTTNENGQAVFMLINGLYNYIITNSGFNALPGNFTVNNANLNINVTLYMVSVDGNTLTAVNVFPNPFQNFISIENAQRVRQVTVTNVIGQQLIEVSTSGNQNETVNTEKLSPGVYLLRVTEISGKETVIKMVKR